jgi:predicted RNA-binding protein (virulence factor B family)
MISIGQHHILKIAKDLDFGLILTDEEENEVLLPRKYIRAGYEVGEELTVFVYKDNEGRPIATSLEPEIKLNDFAALRVRDVTEHGAFMDWGVEKDLFIPFREQAQPLQPGKNYLVYMYLDEVSERLVGSTKIGRFLENDHLRVAEGDEVELLLWQETDLGVNVIVDRIHKGLIYQDNFHDSFYPGKVMKGYVKKIRPGNKLDISLEKFGYEKVEPNAAKILEKLKVSDGFLPFNDKSSPESIKAEFQMSKKLFKKSLGSLYKSRLIRIEADGIYLV